MAMARPLSDDFDDFDCPQFRDFNGGLDEDTVDIDFFNPNKTVDDEPMVANRLQKRAPLNEHDMENSFIVMRKTPRSNDFKLRRPINVTDSEKRRRVSRSLNDIFQAITEENLSQDQKSKIKRVKKKSASACELTGRKITRPITPNCLKRGKTKVFKTTEELELERISEFQKQLAKNLKRNKSVMRKISQKQIPVVKPADLSPIRSIPKFRNKQPSSSTNMKIPTIIEPTPGCSKEPDRRPIATEEIDCNLLQVPHRKVVLEENIGVKLTDLSNALDASQTSCEKNSSLCTTPNLKYAHVGMKFSGKKNNVTVPQPFHFSLPSRKENIALIAS